MRDFKILEHLGQWVEKTVEEMDPAAYFFLKDDTNPLSMAKKFDIQVGVRPRETVVSPKR